MSPTPKPGPPAGSAAEVGSASILLVVALAFAGVLAAVTADVSRAVAARGRAQAAADAAALSAAQELVVPSGRPPAEAAAEYAERNGARLVTCRCPAGGSEAVVVVEILVRLPLLGRERVVRATARAVVDLPGTAAGLQAWFAARVSCLFAQVDGLWIVSGSRTREEQARLHEEHPDLAAPPGGSLHEVGLAADLGFATGVARDSAHAVAASCGLRFPVPHEPWHVEPVMVD